MPPFDLHPSRYLLGILLLTHIASLLVLLQLPLPWWALLVIGGCMLGSFLYSVRHYIARQHPSAIIKIWVDDRQQWQVLLRDGKQYQVKLLGDSVNSQFLVILNVQFITMKRQKQSVVIFHDALYFSDFRRLRKLLLTFKRSA